MLAKSRRLRAYKRFGGVAALLEEPTRRAGRRAVQVMKTRGAGTIYTFRLNKGLSTRRPIFLQDHAPRSRRWRVCCKLLQPRHTRRPCRRVRARSIVLFYSMHSIKGVKFIEQLVPRTRESKTADLGQVVDIISIATHHIKIHGVQHISALPSSLKSQSTL